jgi:hypothetical protein
VRPTTADHYSITAVNDSTQQAEHRCKPLGAAAVLDQVRNYMLGQMLDLSAIVSTAEVVFPSGVFSRTATYVPPRARCGVRGAKETSLVHAPLSVLSCSQASEAATNAATKRGVALMWAKNNRVAWEIRRSAVARTPQRAR